MSKTLDEQFVKIVHDFCDRNKEITVDKKNSNKSGKEKVSFPVTCTPEFIAYKAGYTNRERVNDVFKYGKSGLTLKVASRMIEVMKQIEPGFECTLFERKKGK